MVTDAPTQIFVKPYPGLVVLSLQTGRAIDPEGELVVADGYIRRRLQDGDLIEAAAPRAAKQSKSTAKKEPKQ